MDVKFLDCLDFKKSEPIFGFPRIPSVETFSFHVYIVAETSVCVCVCVCVKHRVSLGKCSVVVSSRPVSQLLSRHVVKISQTT